MKALFTLFILLVPFIGHSQISKASVGYSLGYSFISGQSFKSIENVNGDNFNKLNNGFQFGYLDLTLKINKKIGGYINFASSNHLVSYQGESNDLDINVWYLGFGPIFSFTTNKNIILEIKPQYAPRFKANFVNFNDDLFEETELSGKAFIIGHSFVIGESKGINFSINIDILTGYWSNVTTYGKSIDINDYLGTSDYEKNINKVSLGGSIRYNF